MTLTDTDPMPFGKYKATPMQDVPVGYLHWLWHKATHQELKTSTVLKYIEQNLSALKAENKDLIWSK